MKKHRLSIIIGGITGFLFPILIIVLTILKLIPRKWPAWAMDAVKVISTPPLWVAMLLGCDGERKMLLLIFCFLVYYTIVGAIVGFILSVIIKRIKASKESATDSAFLQPEN